MPGKITGYGLAAGCQVFYHNIYGSFLQCMAYMFICKAKMTHRSIAFFSDMYKTTPKSGTDENFVLLTFKRVIIMPSVRRPLNFRFLNLKGIVSHLQYSKLGEYFQ